MALSATAWTSAAGGVRFSGQNDNLQETSGSGLKASIDPGTWVNYPRKTFDGRVVFLTAKGLDSLVETLNDEYGNLASFLKFVRPLSGRLHFTIRALRCVTRGCCLAIAPLTICYEQLAVVPRGGGYCRDCTRTHLFHGCFGRARACACRFSGAACNFTLVRLLKAPPGFRFPTGFLGDIPSLCHLSIRIVE